MPRTPCPVHGELALELARGELELAEGMRAEETVPSCPTCAAVLARLHHPEVAAGVDEGLALARRGRRGRYRLPAAAAAAALLVAGAVLLAPRGHQPRRAAARELVHGVFDTPGPGAPDLNRDGRLDAADLALALRSGGAPTPRG